MLVQAKNKLSFKKLLLALFTDSYNPVFLPDLNKWGLMHLVYRCAILPPIYIELHSSLKVTEYKLLISLGLTAHFFSANSIVEGYSKDLGVTWIIAEGIVHSCSSCFLITFQTHYQCCLIWLDFLPLTLLTMLLHPSPKSSHSFFQMQILLQPRLTPSLSWEEHLVFEGTLVLSVAVFLNECSDSGLFINALLVPKTGPTHWSND